MSSVASRKTDILFVTHLLQPRDTGTPEVYRPLRMEIGGLPASLPVLRILAAGGDTAAGLRQLSSRIASLGPPPVLTPFYMSDFMFRRGLAMAEIPCLEQGGDALAAHLRDGVGVIALCTTWLPGGRGGTIVRKAAESLRALAPGVPIVAGGVAVRKSLRARTLLAEGGLIGLTPDELAEEFLLMDATRDQALDAVIVCEGGEQTLANIALRRREGRDFRDLPNLAIPEAGGYRFTAAHQERSDVNLELIDWGRHIERLRSAEAPVRTAVGCPFQCGFCDFTGLYAPRSRSLPSLMAELRTLARALPAPRRVFFADDNIALTRKHLLQLTESLIAEKLDLTWRSFIRADTIDADTAALMRDSGCRECLLGIESGDPQVLRNMNKRLDPEQALRAVHLLDAQGIGTQCTFVVGFPGETAASLERTAALISAFPSGDRAEAIHRYYLFRFQVAPLCGVAAPDQRAQWQLKGVGEKWSHRTMSSDEARDAVRTLFLKVRGPSHMYLEMLPPEWSRASTRHVLESRDALQKERLNGALTEADAAGRLLQTVREAEQAARTARA
jgi:radical SAM superfamily enzyme YgiQ (UPF0313 family)